MLKTDYYVVALRPYRDQKASDLFASQANRTLKKASANLFLTYANGVTNGEEYWIFEREDASRRQFDISKKHCRLYGGTLHLVYVRALTKYGAANESFNEGGEILLDLKISAHDAKEYSEYIEKEKRLHDISTCRRLIETAHMRDLSPSGLIVPDTADGDLFKELWHLEKYLEQLCQSGKLSRKEYEEYQQSAETRMIGFSRLPHLNV